MQASANTQAILLLTAPLLIGGGGRSDQVLSNGEYKQVARRLRELGREPADLLGSDAPSLLGILGTDIPAERLKLLLERGFQLSQALDRWTSRAIWVLSRADAHYPRRLKARCKEDAPPVLYGCGEVGLLETGGLAVVGSRDADSETLRFSERVGCLAAQSGRTIVSGAARGVDQAAMGGALTDGGNAVGVLADGLERAALNRENRQFLMDGRLVLVSPFDPAAGFNVGNAMQRNKYIYALADAALVVKAEYKKGGTWAGAAEQLKRLKLVPVYVRRSPDRDRGLDGLEQMGASVWPDPDSPERFANLMDASPPPVSYSLMQEELPFVLGEEVHRSPNQPGKDAVCTAPEGDGAKEPGPPSSEALFAVVRNLARTFETPMTEVQFAENLEITKAQAQEWLRRLVIEGVLEKTSRPVRYQVPTGRSNRSAARD